MFIPRVKLNFMSFSDAKLETKANFIASSLKGNVNFPTPAPPLADLVNAIADYTTALQGAATKEIVQVEIKKAQKITLLNLLRSLADYVNFAGGGSAVILASSGFDVTTPPGSSGPVQAPKTFTATIGKNPGEAITRAGGLSSQKYYNHQCSPDPLTPASIWETYPATQGSFTFTGLESRKKYWFRAQVIGTNGQFVYTEPIGVVIQ
jgi:hypothetical protein